MTRITLRVHEDGSDDERVEQLTTYLRDELLPLAPVEGVRTEGPEGSKAVELALGTLLLTLSQSTVLAAVVTAIATWLGNRRERSVSLEADGDVVEMNGDPTPAEREKVEQWVRRRVRGRYALIIASYEFTDPSLKALRAPAHDAARLGEVLSDGRIGEFEVRTLINSSAAEVNEAVEDFFADREPDDLLVLHFSGHGVKDEAGELHFATAGTRLNRLAGTAVSADFVARRMNRSRSRRIVLLLDCCYSGAFGRGMVARAGGTVGLEEQFGGSGRAVITASSAMEYAFEGADVADDAAAEPSVFTSALVDGLESGDADRDLDGFVGLDELYEYVYDRVRQVTPHQTPGKWMLDVRGDLRIARRARPVEVPAALPSELQEAIDHSLPGVRAGAVPELRRMLQVRHQGRALAARLALRKLVEDDSRMVASAAKEALGETEQPHVPAPTSLMAPAAKPTPVAPERKAAPKPAEPVRVTRLVASGAGSSGPPEPPARVPEPVAGRDVWRLAGQVIAGLALVALVLGFVTVPAPVTRFGESAPATALIIWWWPWALVAAVFLMACRGRDRDWVPGAALGLTAGVATLITTGSGQHNWLVLAGLALTVLAFARRDWVTLTGSVFGAGMVVVVVTGAEPIFDQGGEEEIWQPVFIIGALVLVGLAGYRAFVEKAWFEPIVPVLLMATAVWQIAENPYPFPVPMLAVLVVAPTVEILTTGPARLVARLVIVTGILTRLGEYALHNTVEFSLYAQVVLVLAAAGAAYYFFSRSR